MLFNVVLRDAVELSWAGICWCLQKHCSFSPGPLQMPLQDLPALCGGARALSMPPLSPGLQCTGWRSCRPRWILMQILGVVGPLPGRSLSVPWSPVVDHFFLSSILCRIKKKITCIVILYFFCCESIFFPRKLWALGIRFTSFVHLWLTEHLVHGGHLSTFLDTLAEYTSWAPRMQRQRLAASVQCGDRRLKSLLPHVFLVSHGVPGH